MEGEVDIKHQDLKSTLAKTKTDNETLDNCVICLDAVSERAVAVPCRHQSFDFLCLLSWLEERPLCPLCKTAVRSVEYNFRSARDFQIYNVTLGDCKSKQGITGSTTLHTIRSLQATSCPPRPRHSRQPEPQISPDAALNRRRQIYRDQLYSLHVGTNRISRFQDLTPQRFVQDDTLISRARMWIRRELQVFGFLDSGTSSGEGLTRRANNAEFLLEYIVAILKTVDIKGSGGQAEDMLQEFLGRDNTRLFLHELRAWLRSPYLSLEAWDRNIQYTDSARRERTHEVSQPSDVVRDDVHHSVGNFTKRSRSSTRGDSYRPCASPQNRYSKRPRTERHVIDRD